MIPPDVLPGSLVLLVGPAGAGKSTFADRWFPSTQVLSSDTLRAMVADDPADQGANADAFRVLHALAAARLKRGLTTVVDATNLTTAAHRPLLTLAARHGRPAIAIVFDRPLERCLAQNAARMGRHVPDHVVRLHHAQLGDAVEALRREGVAILTAEG